MTLIDGGVAVVTGGASGNGRAIAIALARHGASDIVIADVREDPREGGEPTQRVVERETGVRAVHVPCDLASGDGLEGVVAEADRLGGATILVNNAGVYWASSFLDETPESFDRMFGVNVRGPYLLTQALARGMVSRRRGSIVNVTSGAALVGSRRRSAYCASKGALHALTYALAAELAPRGVRVNAVVPGSIRTAMTTVDVPALRGEGELGVAKRIPVRRVGEPDDVANAVVYLCSELAGFVNGVALEVDGGELNTVDLDEE